MYFVWCLLWLPESRVWFRRLEIDRTTRDVCHAFVDSLFRLLKVEDRISYKALMEYMLSDQNSYEDVWELLGRSMLKDFSERS